MGEKPKRLAAEWASFERLVLPARASEVQRTEMRRAFYAGAQATFHVMMSTLTPGDEPQDADLTMLESLHAELEEWESKLERREV